jgi:hypothetical protein
MNLVATVAQRGAAVARGTSGPWKIDHDFAAVKKTNRCSDCVIRTTHSAPAWCGRICLLGELMRRCGGCAVRPGGNCTAMWQSRFAAGRKFFAGFPRPVIAQPDAPGHPEIPLFL